MKKDFFNWRMSVIGILSMLTIVCIASEPEDNETWFTVFITSKIIGLAIGYLVYRLASYWGKKNLIPKLNNEDEEV